MSEKTDAVKEAVAQKIIANRPMVERLANIDIDPANVSQVYEKYFEASREEINAVPDLRGMSGMDAVSILENLGVEVEIRGNGKVKKQSVGKGTSLKKVKKIILELS